MAPWSDYVDGAGLGFLALDVDSHGAGEMVEWYFVKRSSEEKEAESEKL